jgi:hypothetical protein
MATAKITPGTPAVTQVIVPEQPETVTLVMSREEAQAIMTLTANVHNAKTELKTSEVHYALERAGIRYFGHSHVVAEHGSEYDPDALYLLIKKGPKR